MPLALDEGCSSKVTFVDELLWSFESTWRQ